MPAIGVVGLLGWYAGNLLGLGGLKLWLFRGGLWLLGILLVFLVYRLLPKKEKGPATASEDAEITSILATAARRLAGSGVTGKKGFRSLPVVLFLGPAGSAKTSVVQRAGVETDLLAGDGDSGEPPPPTPNLNLWLSQKTLFLEAGDGVTQSSQTWHRVLREIRTKAFSGLFQGQPSRIAVVCVSSEWLTGKDRQALGTLGKELRVRLNEAAELLDTRLPVYVLFTKADEIRYFTEFVRNLNESESTEPLGVTLPLSEGQDPGLFTQWQAKRLREAFESVFLALARRRIDVMARAGDPVERSSAYEFPREFRKLADKAQEFLLELTRPDQLRVSSFLRGFYFTGIRPLSLDSRPEPAVAPPIPQVPRGATMVFDPSSLVAEPQPPQGGGGRVAQWTFLGRLLPQVLLRDTVAVAASLGGPRAALRKRALLGSGVGLVAVLGLLLTISFFGNRGLQGETQEAIRSVENVRSAGPGVPSLENLERLEVLRPLWIRWGLYSGSSMFPNARRLYFDRFRTLLFEATMAGLTNTLGNPSAEGTQEQYDAKYSALKAYLITTSFPDSSSGSFLSPVLTAEWLGERELDDERRGIVRRQFDLYASELPHLNPYQDATNDLLVERARAFLRDNATEQSLYAAMLSQANSQFASVQLNRDFPGSANYVVNAFEVPGAFTSGGWDFVLQSLESAADLFDRDSYVVGPDYFSGLDPDQMTTSLRAQYQREYIQTWVTFLSSATIPNPGMTRAENALRELASPRSPLLQMFHVASTNTGVLTDSAIVAPSFQPLHVVSPPELTERLYGDGSQGYMTDFGQLAGAMGQLAGNPGSCSAQEAATTAAQAASGKIDALQSSFNISPDAAVEVGSSVEQLLRAPIRFAQSAIDRGDAAAMEGRGQRFCRGVGAVLQQFPFQIQGQDADLTGVNDLLHSDGGVLWDFLDDIRNSGLTLSPEFQRFVDRARVVSNAFYSHEGPDPRLRFRFRGQPTDQVPAIALNVDGDEKSFVRNDTGWETYTWESASAGEVVLRVEVGGQSEDLIHRGTWALFKFFQQADWQPSGDTWRLSWTMDDSGATVQADLNLGGLDPILRRGFFDGFSCPRSFVR